MLLKLFLTLVLPLGTWFLLGEPSFDQNGAKVVFGVIVFFEISSIWINSIAKFTKSDLFTYGSVIKSLSAMSTIVAVLTGGIYFWLRKLDTYTFREINSLVYLIWLACFSSMWIFPLLTASTVSKLPKPSDRRNFEDPI